MRIFIVIATEMYERGYDIVGARRTREAAEQLAEDAEAGRFPPSEWSSETARELYRTEHCRWMCYDIEEVTVE